MNEFKKYDCSSAVFCFHIEIKFVEAMGEILVKVTGLIVKRL